MQHSQERVAARFACSFIHGEHATRRPRSCYLRAVQRSLFSSWYDMWSDLVSALCYSSWALMRTRRRFGRIPSFASSATLLRRIRLSCCVTFCIHALACEGLLAKLCA